MTNKQKRVPLTLNLEEELVSKVREVAEINRRTISGEVTVLIETALAMRDPTKASKYDNI